MVLRSALKEGGKARGLPSGMLLQDLVASKTEAIPPTHDDGNPDVGCEFFETRQVPSQITIILRYSIRTSSPTQEKVVS